MNDLISRQAAIDVEGLDEQIRCEMCRNPMHTNRGCDGNCKYDEKLYERIMQILGERIKPLPSVQPTYTDEQIQRMQNMEQAQLDKAFELGREDAKPQWIPCSERLPEVYEAGNSVSGMFMQSRPVLVYGVPEHESEHGFHVVTYCDDLNGITYWSTELDAVTINEVIAWMPLPEPYKGR